MASLFSPPRPRIIAPPPPAAPPPAPLEDEEEELREEAKREASRPRGLQATIVTSPRGLLEEADRGPRRKQLLGD